jgi:hypothetical protein
MAFIAAAASVVGAVIGSKATKSAADTQAGAARYAADLQKEQFDKTIELQQPFRDAGLAGQNRLMQLLGIGPGYDQSRNNFNPEAYLAANPDAAEWVKVKGGNVNDNAYQHWVLDGKRRQGNFWNDQTVPADFGSAMRDFSMADFQKDPGYEFRQQQGQQGLERSAAARGGLLSGAAMKDAMRFNQGLASDEYTNAFNRFQTNRSNKLNPLQSLAGVGQSTTNTIANAGQTYATNVGNAMMGGADARASGYLAQGRIASNALNQLGAIGSRWWDQYNKPQGDTGVGPSSLSPY